ncbi:MAG: serine/threonine-protein phosphatase, partial [Leptospiraceae bacterium]|nr:serine/threonine-protein phosphatase [Leptospiraceae bacterium]
SPADILKKLNKDLLLSLNEHYFSAIFCHLNTKKEKLYFANAGGTPGIIKRRAKEKTILLHSTGTLLGIMEDPELIDKAANFYIGDKLLLFTDGLSEEKNHLKEEFGIVAISQILESEKEKSCDKGLKEIFKGLQEFSGYKTFKDDVTCILVG